MPKFSILSRVRNTTVAELQQLLGTMEMQTSSDWELVLLTGYSYLADQALVADLLESNPQLRHEVRPDDELVEWSANALLETLGTWVGFLGQQDLLLPEALATMGQAIATAPATQVAYSDEEARNRFGHISGRFSKGAINPLRLRHQEYLRDLALIRTAWLQELGGFDLLASDWPRHDLYLRTLEARGPAAFLNVGVRLFQRFWNPRFPIPDARRKTHMVGFDLHGIRQALARLALPAKVRQRAGTAEIRYRFDRRPWVTLLIVDNGSQVLAEAQKTLAETTLYRPLTVKVVAGGEDLVERLNQEMLRCDTDLVCLLQGLPLNPDWLGLLVDHAMLAGAGAIGGRLSSPTRLTQPGLVNYRFEGWDWNTRGRFNELAVPHQVSAISPHALVIDPRVFLAYGQFRPEFPTLYAMDLCLRLDAAGRANCLVPDAQILVEETLPATAEITNFWAAWPDWSCRFGLHLPRE